MVKDSSSIASIQHLSKIVPKHVAQHLKAHCSIMWMKVGTDLSRPRFEKTREEVLKEISTHIWKSGLLLCSSTKIKQSRWCDIQVELHKTLLKQKCFA